MNFSYPSPSLFAALVILLLSFTACRQDAADAGETTVDPATLDFKRTENVVTTNFIAEPRSLNPFLTTQGYDRFIYENVIQSLNTFHPETFESVPVLAELPTITPREDGGLDYTFDIREEATWPNGTPVTAEDLVFTLKALFNPEVAASPYRPYFSMIKNVVLTPSNAKRIRIETNEKYILAEAALASLPVYPAYAYDPDGLLNDIRLSDLLDPGRAAQMVETNENLKAFAKAFNDDYSGRGPGKMVGSGPYELVEWESGQDIRLERRDDYWAAGTDDEWLMAGPDALVYSFILDENTLANAIRDQEIDAASEVQASSYLSLRREKETGKYYDFVTLPGFVYYSLLLNTSDPMLADKKTRRALAHLVDVDFIINNFYDSLATRVTGPILPQKPYYHGGLIPIPYNTERAAALLTEAGWEDTNGNGTLDRSINGEVRELELDLLTFTSEISQNMSTLMQSSAEEVGVKINVTPLDPRTLYGRLATGEYHVATMGSGSEPGLDDLTQNFSTKSVPPNGTNRSRFGNAETDRIIQRIRTEMDEARRNELYREIQEVIYDEQPMIFLFSPLQRIVLSKRFAAEPTGLSPGFKVNSFEQKDWNQPKE